MTLVDIILRELQIEELVLACPLTLQRLKAERISRRVEDFLENQDFLKRLRATNKDRNYVWGDSNSPDIMYRALEFAGEAGEVANEVKKLYREEKGWKGSRTTIDKLEDEIGDVMTTLDSVAEYFGVDIKDATIRKFNAVSEKHGFTQKL